jgi:hypothetical protein
MSDGGVPFQPARIAEVVLEFGPEPGGEFRPQAPRYQSPLRHSHTTRDLSKE